MKPVRTGHTSNLGITGDQNVIGKKSSGAVGQINPDHIYIMQEK